MDIDASKLYDSPGSQALAPPPAPRPESTIITNDGTPPQPPAPQPVAKPPASPPAPEVVDASRVLFKDDAGLQTTFYMNSEKLQEHGVFVTPEQQKVMQSDYAGMVQDFSVDLTDARNIHDLLAGAMIHPTTEQQSQAWKNESLNMMRERYGADTDRILAKARDLLGKRPELKTMLTATGLANHPKVVLSLMEGARRRW